MGPVPQSVIKELAALTSTALDFPLVAQQAFKESAGFKPGRIINNICYKMFMGKKE